MLAFPSPLAREFMLKEELPMQARNYELDPRRLAKQSLEKRSMNNCIESQLRVSSARQPFNSHGI
jgi:hypothetical protein